MIALIAALIFVFLTINLLTKSKTKTKGMNLPPGSYGWPLIGETLAFVRVRTQGSPENFVRERVDKYKSNVFKTSLLGESVAVLSGPAANKLCFSGQNKLVKVWWPASMMKLHGECVITTEGAEGMQMRKMVSYFLSPDAFTKLYMETLNIATHRHIETQWQGKKELKVHPVIKNFTFEVACRLFMSIDDPKKIEKLFAYFKICATGVFSIPLDFPGTRFYNGKRAADEIRREIQIILNQRREELEKKTCTKQDLLSHLLVSPDENGKIMSDPVIINNVLLLLIAGHDTSTSAISMIVRTLAKYPQVYDKVLAEQSEIASSKKPGESLLWEDIQKMRYSRRVVNETMRLWPSVATFAREALVDISYEGYIIPKGWKIFSYMSSTHKDPNLFPDTEEFDPSRFDENAGPAPYSFVPFGGGPRMCAGKEFARLVILTFLHSVVTSFKWELLMPDERVRYDPMAKPENGLPIRLHPHKQ